MVRERRKNNYSTHTEYFMCPLTAHEVCYVLAITRKQRFIESSVIIARRRKWTACREAIGSCRNRNDEIMQCDSFLPANPKRGLFEISFSINLSFQLLNLEVPARNTDVL